MNTIHPAGLARLLSNHEVFDLIDVRPKEEFKRLHIPGARSNPLNEMTPVKILRERKLPASAPLFVVSQDRALAGMAAGILRGAGCIQPVVVEGGMETWEAQGLPAVHTSRFHW
jgi:rhodanese-related sulfurtransferase